MPRFRVAGVCLFLCSFAALAGSPAVDWKKTQSEILAHYTALLKLNTSSPPGNETLAARYLQQVLEREGIPSRIFALEPDRANVVARLKGNGSKKPLLLMGHTDVVGVQRDKWTVDPFSAIRQDGYVYGRGAIDDKDKVTACLMVLLTLKRLHLRLDRDVIFLGEAGEEGTTRVGIDYMVKEHWDEIAAEYALTEGGGGLIRNGHPVYATISTTEKVPRGVRLIAHGTAGHGSVPRPDNAVSRLALAVGKISAWQPSMRLNDTTRAYFERLATVSAPQDAARYNGLVNRDKAPTIEKYFAEHELTHYSMLRTSVVPTILKAGFRSNVIPSEAEATLDVRALPDEDLDKLVAEMRSVINDPNVDVVMTKTGRPAGQPSRLDNEMFKALENSIAKTYPGAITLPTMLTGATDMAQLRARGVQAYGFGPMIEDKDRFAHAAHGDDERLQERALYKMVEFLWNAVTEVAAAK